MSSTLGMSIRISLFAAAALACGASASAQSQEGRTRAVQETNFSLGLAASDADTPDSTSNGTLGIGVIGTLPIGDLFGVAVSADYARSTARTRDVLGDVTTSSSTSTRPSCEFDNLGGEATLFARRPTLGRISVSYGIGSLKSECGDGSVFVSTGDDKMGVDHYSADVEAYIADFTLAASHTTTELEDGPSLDSDLFSASWYPIDSLRVSLEGGTLHEEDTYGFELEHQPEFMGNALSVLLGYSVTDRESEVRTVNFGVVYHFGRKVELKTRDRQYR
jgi:hypothetical protein